MSSRLWRSVSMMTCFICALSVCSNAPCAAKWGQISQDLFWGTVRNREDIARAKTLGIKTIINVRTNPKPEEGKYAQQLGIKYFHIRTGVVKPPTMPMIKDFLKIVCDPDNRPVYIGCQGGRDRTAFYVATYKIARQGVPAREAASWMSKQGLQDRKLRMWWPTFRRYDDILIERESEIKRLARQYESAAHARASGKSTMAKSSSQSSASAW